MKMISTIVPSFTDDSLSTPSTPSRISHCPRYSLLRQEPRHADDAEAHGKSQCVASVHPKGMLQARQQTCRSPSGKDRMKLSAASIISLSVHPMRPYMRFSYKQTTSPFLYTNDSDFLSPLPQNHSRTINSTHANSRHHKYHIIPP